MPVYASPPAHCRPGPEPGPLRGLPARGPGSGPGRRGGNRTPARPPYKTLILRKRAALSRRMGSRFRAVWPILRDGPEGPPQDEVFQFGSVKKDPRPIHSARPQPSTVIPDLIGDPIHGFTKRILCARHGQTERPLVKVPSLETSGSPIKSGMTRNNTAVPDLPASSLSSLGAGYVSGNVFLRHPGLEPGPGRHKRIGFLCCPNNARRFPDPGSALCCVRDDDGEKEAVRLMFLSAPPSSPPLSSRTSAARSGTHSFPEPFAGGQRSGHNCLILHADRRVGPGSALTLVRGDTGEKGIAHLIRTRAGSYPQTTLILRKRAALSRRMGHTFLRKLSILRDGPDGPPQDEGLGTKVTASGTGFPAVIPATRSARRDRGGADPAAFPHLSLSSRPSAARAGTHSFPELCEGTLRSGHNHPMRQAERRVGPGSALTLVRGDSRRRKRQEVRR